MKRKSHFPAALAAIIGLGACCGAAAALDPIAFIQGELAQGRKTICLPPGVYRLEEPKAQVPKFGMHVSGRAYLYLKDVKDVTIDFGGSKFHGAKTFCMVRLDACARMTLKNLVIDYPENLPFTQGVIEAVGPDGEWDVRICDGYPDVASWMWPIQAYDAKTHDLVNPMRYRQGVKVVRTAPGRVRVTGGGNRRGKVGDIAVGGCRCGGDHAVYATGCEDIRFEDITVYSTPGSNAFREMTGGGGNTYLRCRVVPCPQGADPVKRAMPRLRSGGHDAFNSRAMRKGPIYDWCEARNHCDDDININGGYWMVVSAEGTKVRALSSDGYHGAFAAGPVQLMMPDGTVPADTPVVASFRESSPPGDAELEMLKSKGLVPQLARSVNHAYEFILEKPDARFIPGAVFVPQNAGGNGWTIRNCRFGPNRARALILNASFGVVENCVFDRTEGQAIRASSSYPWLEGGCARNVTVRGCTFIDCNCYFGAVLGNGGTLPAASHREIAIEGNRFRGRSRVIVHGCTGLKIAGNTFDCEPEHSVELRNVADVSCSDSRSHVAAGVR